MAKRLVLVLVLCTNAVAASEWTPNTWKEVRVTADPYPSRGCKVVEAIHAELAASSGQNLTTTLHDQLKWKAAEKGANLVVVAGQPSEESRRNENGTFRRVIVLTGESFICGAGLPLRAAHSTPSAVGSECAKNFKRTVKALINARYSSTIDAPGVPLADAIRRVEEQFTWKNIRTTYSGPDVLRGAGSVGDKNFSIEVNFYKLFGNQLKVGATLAPDALVTLDNDHARDLLCSIVAAVQADTPQVRGSAAAHKQDAEPTTTLEDRMRKLDILYKKKMITKEEYEKKRAEILKDL